MAAGRFSKRTTLPSGCMKNLSRWPGFNPRCSRMAFGIVACPLLVSADSMDDLPAPLHFTKCDTLPPCVQPPHADPQQPLVGLEGRRGIRGTDVCSARPVCLLPCSVL